VRSSCLQCDLCIPDPYINPNANETETRFNIQFQNVYLLITIFRRFHIYMACLLKSLCQSIHVYRNTEPTFAKSVTANCYKSMWTRSYVHQNQTNGGNTKTYTDSARISSEEQKKVSSKLCREERHILYSLHFLHKPRVSYKISQITTSVSTRM
jgi:hypothetical protein